MSNDKILNFTDLNAWQESHLLYVKTYSATKKFPQDEIFGLTSQIRRSSLSVTSNIAEGFGRSSVKDRLHFYIMARGSLCETQNQLIAAKDVNLLAVKEFELLHDQSEKSKRILIGLINATKKL